MQRTFSGSVTGASILMLFLASTFSVDTDNLPKQNKYTVLNNPYRPCNDESKKVILNKVMYGSIILCLINHNLNANIQYTVVGNSILFWVVLLLLKDLNNFMTN